ncbi:hypothetical protein [Arcicella rosea]|uniref:Beta-lactamase-inhibitor-like, PepSY-like n=1 Tax=Arcicella rosea TaxID=502909 RepID=A0A841EM43_9BACT|nr:hypothetical protein [Arcicella rosea]MBB6002093.1 hypothetical protein [Arcicella rosea]
MKKILFVVALAFTSILTSCEESLDLGQQNQNETTDAASAAKVSAVIKQDYPTATQLVVTTIDSNKVYGCDFLVNGVAHEATVSVAGKILSTYEIKADTTKTALIDAIKLYLETNYKGYKLEKVAIGKDADGKVSYKILIEFNDKKITLLFDATGTILATFIEPKGQKPDPKQSPKTYTVVLSELPANIQSQLSGYEFVRALVKTNSDGKKTYFVVAKIGDVLYEITFDNAGVLKNKNAVKLQVPKLEAKYLKETELPQVIKDYLSANYAAWKFEKGVVLVKDTIIDSYTIVVVKEGKFITLSFDGKGKFISVLEPKSPTVPKIEDKSIVANDLPQAIKDYLNKVYVGWIFVKGSVSLKNDVAQAYLVLITFGTDKYYVYFDKDGNFVAAKKDK